VGFRVVLWHRDLAIDLLVAYGLANIFAAIPVTPADWASSKVY